MTIPTAVLGQRPHSALRLDEPSLGRWQSHEPLSTMAPSLRMPDVPTKGNPSNPAKLVVPGAKIGKCIIDASPYLTKVMAFCRLSGVP